MDKIIDRKTLKHALRAELRGITVDNRPTKDSEIFGTVTELNEYKAAKNVYAFLPTEREPDLFPIIEACFRDGKRVAVPVAEANTPIMEFYEIFECDRFVTGAFGIKEPVLKRAVDFTPDLIIVPMVAYDNNKNRLGHGNGYYDRFLRYGFSSIKVGVSYSDFKVDTVFPEPHDIPMNLIVTDKGVIL